MESTLATLSYSRISERVPKKFNPTAELFNTFESTRSIYDVLSGGELYEFFFLEKPFSSLSSIWCRWVIRLLSLWKAASLATCVTIARSHSQAAGQQRRTAASWYREQLQLGSLLENAFKRMHSFSISIRKHPPLYLSLSISFHLSLSVSMCLYLFLSFYLSLSIVINN